MFDLPKEPEEIIRYVLIFLPGFLVLSGVLYITNQSTTEYEFTYYSIGLSVLIYLGSFSIVKWCNVDRLGSATKKPLGIGALSSVVIVISLASLGVLSWVIEKEVILVALRAMGTKVEKQSTRALLPYYFNLDHNNAVGPVDRRPVAQWKLCEGKANCPEYAYNIYVRAKAGDEVFEGRVTRYTLAPEANGFPFALSPACRMTTTGGVEAPQLVEGPGVVFFAEKLDYMELKEQCASACYRMIQPEECANAAPMGASAPAAKASR